MGFLNLSSLLIGLFLLNFITNGFYSSFSLIIIFIVIFKLSKHLLFARVSFVKYFNFLPYLYCQSFSQTNCSLIDNRLFKWIQTKNKEECYYCSICEERRCHKHEKKFQIDLFPERKVLINSRLNTLLNQCVDLLLMEIEILKASPKLKKDVKKVIAFMIASLLIRLNQKLKINDFILNQAFSSLAQHLKLFMKGKKKAKSARFIEDQVLEVYKEEGFFCDDAYLHCLIQSCQHFLFSFSIQSNRALSLFSLDLISNCVIKPFINLISNPYYFNTFILLVLGEKFENSKSIQLTSIQNYKFVYLLDEDDEEDNNDNDNGNESQNCGNKANASTSAENGSIIKNEVDDANNKCSLKLKKKINKKNIFDVTLKEIINNEQLLFIFIQFLRQEGAVNLIQFLISIDSLTSKLLNPNLNCHEKEKLKHECQLLYQEYFEESSPDYIHFKNDEIKILFQKLIKEESEIFLDNIDSIYQAYDEVHLKVTQLYLPQFVESSFYLKTILGSQTFDSNLLEKNKKFLVSSELDSHLKLAQKKIDEWESKDDDDNQLVRDLSSWRVLIEKVEKKTKFDSNDEEELNEEEDKLVYLIKVSDVKEQFDWKVQRGLDEFYVLQSKLRQFHGNIEGLDYQLPKRKNQLFSSSLTFSCTSCNVAFLNEKKDELQAFLESLLFNPYLKSSSLLHSFLKPSSISSTFNQTSVDFKKILKNFNSILLLKSGSDLKASLSPFIFTFLNSTESRNRFNNEMDKNLNENASVQLKFDIWEMKETVEDGDNERKEKNEQAQNQNKNQLNDNFQVKIYFYDYLLFVMNKIFELNENNSSNYYLLKLWEPILKKVLQFILSWVIDKKIKEFLSLNNLIYCLEELKLILKSREKSFENEEEERMKKKKEKDALNRLQKKTLCFSSFSTYVFQIFSCFQYQSLNKQFIFLLINQIYQVLFSELLNNDISH